MQITQLLTGRAQSNLVLNNQASDALTRTGSTSSHLDEQPLGSSQHNLTFHLCISALTIFMFFPLSPAPSSTALPLHPSCLAYLVSYLLLRLCMKQAMSLWRQDTSICLFMVCVHSSSSYQLYCLICNNNSIYMDYQGKICFKLTIQKGEVKLQLHKQNEVENKDSCVDNSKRKNHFEGVNYVNLSDESEPPPPAIIMQEMAWVVLSTLSGSEGAEVGALCARFAGRPTHYQILGNSCGFFVLWIFSVTELGWCWTELVWIA